jgi:hypothetical protein
MSNKLNERGLSSIGGVPHSDTSGHLGRARKPVGVIGTGGHSQSADSGYSSKLGNVNRNRDDEQYADRDMFPDNVCDFDDDEEDDYDMELRSKISLDLRGRKAMPEVRTLSYILNADIDDLIKENEERQALIDEDLIEEEDEDVDEHSIGGYTGPMTPPANPKKFYKGMLRSYPGSNYVGDLPKSRA